jgi:hypothetical protein
MLERAKVVKVQKLQKLWGAWYTFTLPHFTTSQFCYLDVGNPHAFPQSRMTRLLKKASHFLLVKRFYRFPFVPLHTFAAN